MVEHAPTSPNILWIVTDEHRPDSLGCYGSSVACTPNLDRLAREGTLFEAAYCQAPVCVPSRASFKTGKSCRTLGVLNNTMSLNLGPWHREQMRGAVRAMGEEAWCGRVAEARSGFVTEWARYTVPVPDVLVDYAARIEAARRLARDLGLDERGPRHRMFMELLADRGYQTINIGKLHHQGLEPGFQECPVPPGADVLSPWGWLTELGVAEPDDIVRLPGGNMLLAGTCPVPAEQTPEALHTDLALAYLADPARLREPFLLRVSYLWPHTPVLVPEPYNTMYDPREFTVALPSDDEVKTHSRWVSRARLLSRGLPVQQIQQARAHYFGLVSFIDGEIGRLLQGLDASPHAGNTLVVFHADHGALHGDHGLWQKDTFYEPVVRVPFILRMADGSGRGRRVAAPIELTDLAPTLLAATGTEIPDDMEGLDLGPTLRGQTERPHQHVFSEDASTEPIGDDGVPAEPTAVRCMMHDGEWRLEAMLPQDSLYGLDGALFNVREDPAELHNRFYDPPARAQAQRLLDVLRDHVDA